MSVKTHLQRPIPLAAVVLLVLLGATILGITRLRIDAALAQGGSISGTVTDESTSDPLPNICAGVVDTSGGLVAFGTTDPSGDYSVGGLAPGEYKVAFAVCFTQEVYEWYDDKAGFDAADLVPVADGVDTGGIDAALAVGSISGTATDASSSDSLLGIDVCVYQPPDAAVGFLGCLQTDGSGDYMIRGLPARDYKIKFRDPSGAYATEWYDDKGDLPSADLVSVTVGAVTTGIDAALGAAGSISGTVTDEISSDPLADIEVCAHHEQAGPGAPWTFQVECGTSDALGAYSVGRLRTGNYEVDFRDASATYGFEWYNDQGVKGSANSVAVTGGADTANIDAALPLAGSITGTITDESTDDPLPDIRVCRSGPDSPSEFWPPCYYSDPSGVYQVPGLRPGDYVLDFQDLSGVYLGEWYDDKPDSASADPVSVMAGTATSDINAALTRALRIGALLPFAGWLSEFGPVLLNAAQLAQEHVNEAGGVFGGDIQIISRDTQTDPTPAVEECTRLVDEEEVTAIVGAVSSGVTIPVAEHCTVPRGVLQMSPASTAPAITTLADDDYLFRTAISDAVQGKRLAELAIGQGYTTASTLYVDTSYGQGLSDRFTREFESLGGELLAAVPRGGGPCSDDVALASVGNPDVLVVLVYDCTECVTAALQNDPNEKLLFADGCKSEDMVDSVCATIGPNPGCLDGTYGTAPASLDTPAGPDFDSDYEEAYGEPPEVFAREAYDAVILAALAAEAAGSTSSSLVRDELRGVSRPGGEDVGLADGGIGYALSLVRLGQDVNYEGASGCVDLDANGDVACGATETWQIESDEFDNFISTVSIDPWWQNSDGDSCVDSQEWALGDNFDEQAWYDVYDVPVPAYPDPQPNGPRNKVVGIGDVLAALFYAFADEGGSPNANGVDYDSDKNGDARLDGRDYDRSPGLGPDPVTGIDPAGAPNGVIDIGDVLACLAQVFVVDCTAGP